MKDFKVPALEKGLEVIETLSQSAAPMSIAELCRTLDRSTGELYRVVGFLEEKGYIAKDPHTGNFRLTLKLFELAHMHSPVEQLLRAAAIPMRELADELKQSCHLSVLRRTELIVLHQEESPLKYRLSVEVGGRFDALGTASGRLLTAYLPREEREWLFERHTGFQEMSDGEKAALTEKIEQVRAAGYSFADSESHTGVRDYAVLIGNPQAGFMAALAVPWLTVPGGAIPEEELLAKLRERANGITGALGMTPAI
ncbi:IclR family transcriptional regulator [Cohnella zeiphila]|uniref:IclR family transcriptional regulator n=1 Tax=Cohnella zeiphila TaxID=2761120 RepID=A0A7X0SJA2_9BACL|nr:IclR family transcriptional regulator [Cohnella zeiphila]MBB6731015.1 IclR family transcriptional regulator [Cohnella zeiphila]